MAEYLKKELVWEMMKDKFCCNLVRAKNAFEIIPTADVQPVDRWISVEDKLPEDDGDCLVWYRCDTVFGKSESWGIAHCSRCDWYTKHLDGDNIVVLHWQPMPEPPETKKG